MAITALDFSTTKRHICSFDKGEPPTVFEYGTLTSGDVGAIRDAVTKITFKGDLKDSEVDEEGRDFTTQVNTSAMNREAVRRGLRGWENLMDSKGKPITFKTRTREIDRVQREVVPDDLLNLLPLPVIAELGEKILEENSLKEEDSGNSQGPSTDG